MFGLLDKILKAIPGNGAKTAIGALLMIAGDLIVPGQALITQIGEVVATFGLIHKLVKAKLKK